VSHRGPVYQSSNPPICSPAFHLPYLTGEKAAPKHSHRMLNEVECGEWPAKVGQVVTRQGEAPSDLSTAAYPASKRAFTPWTEKSRAPVIGT
jgi:hypothetical protein